MTADWGLQRADTPKGPGCTGPCLTFPGCCWPYVAREPSRPAAVVIRPSRLHIHGAGRPAACCAPPPGRSGYVLLGFLVADKSKAAKAAKAVKKSQFKKARKPRYSVVFHRPKTLVRSRDPKFPRIRYSAAAEGLCGREPCRHDSGSRRLHRAADASEQRA